MLLKILRPSREPNLWSSLVGVEWYISSGSSQVRSWRQQLSQESSIQCKRAFLEQAPPAVHRQDIVSGNIQWPSMSHYWLASWEQGVKNVILLAMSFCSFLLFGPPAAMLRSLLVVLYWTIGSLRVNPGWPHERQIPWQWALNGSVSLPWNPASSQNYTATNPVAPLPVQPTEEVGDLCYSAALPQVQPSHRRQSYILQLLPPVSHPDIDFWKQVIRPKLKCMCKMNIIYCPKALIWVKWTFISCPKLWSDPIF